MEKEELYVNAIQNAGSVFVGNYTPESAKLRLNESTLPRWLLNNMAE